MRKILMPILIIVLAIILISCNEGELKEFDLVEITHEVSVFDKNDANNEPVYKKTMKTENFKINPEIVLTYNLGIADTFNYLGLDFLGIKTFGVPKDKQVLPEPLAMFNNKKYPDVGSLFEPDLNALDLLNADLIILDGRTSSKYETLKNKYPNTDILDLSISEYSLEKQSVNFAILKKIFPQIDDKLEIKLTEFEQSFNNISSVTNDYSVLFLNMTGKTILVNVSPNGRYGAINKIFGFQNAISPEYVFDRVVSHGGSEIEVEFIEEMNPDVIFILDRNVIVSGETSDRLIFRDLNANAIKNNLVFDVNPYAWYTITGGVNSTQTMINDINNFVNQILD